MNIYKGEYEKAIECCNKSIELELDNAPEPYQGLYEVYKELNQPEKAEEYLNKAKELGYEPEE